MTEESQKQQLEQAIAALQAQRETLGEAVVAAALAPLREKLAQIERSNAQEQRKLVTVLFADLVGFTALAEKLDPEEVRLIQQAYFRAVTAPIQAQGGYVEKYIGDAVVAVFGVHQSQENDPDRALRAALGMQAALQELNLRLEAETGIHLDKPLQMRVGVNTGLVVVARKDNGEFEFTGDAVNLASRLQSAAPAGGVLISQDTYRHVRGVFEAQSQELLSVKGRSQPVQTYQVLSAKPRPFHLGYRGVEGIETRMIGRQAEFKLLQDMLIEAIEENACRMITISGEAGVGKSRLLYEFESWAELRPESLCYFKGRAHQETQHQAFGLLRDMFVFRFQIQDGDPADKAREKLVQGLSEALGDDETGQMKAHFIGQLLGFDFSLSPHLRPALQDAQQISERATVYLGDYFEAVADEAPLLILLEDVHWADDSSLDALNQLGSRLANQAVLIIALARPTLFERRPHWGEGQLDHTRLELRRLSKGDTRLLVAEVLQKIPQVPEALRELVAGNAEGNPFYVEELIKMLIEEGVIVKQEPYWQARPERLATLRVPPTLTGVLQARLDSLPPGERAVIQQAAVIGRVFWDAAVAYIDQAEGRGLSQDELTDRLAALRRKEMVFQRETTAFAEATEHIFKHAVLREVTYESVLKRLRRAYHARAAEWLIAQSHGREAEFAGLIADHLERAGQAEPAVEYLIQAGEHAAANYANQEAVGYFSRALALLPEIEFEQRFIALMGRCKVFSHQSNFQAQQADLEILERIAAMIGDSSKKAEVALSWGDYYIYTYDIPKALVAAQQAVASAEKAGNLFQEARAQALLGNVQFHLNDSKAAEHFTKAIDLARETGQFSLVSRCLRGLGNTAHYLNRNPAQANEYMEQALSFSHQVGDAWEDIKTLHDIAFIYLSCGDFLAALEPIENSQRIIQKIGGLYNQGFMLMHRCEAAYQEGDLIHAQEYGEQALAIFRLINTPRPKAYVLAMVGRTFNTMGIFPDALEYLEASLALARHSLSEIDVVDVLVRFGHALTNQGRLEQAESAYREAIDIINTSYTSGFVKDSQAIARAGLAKTALAQGQFAESSEYISEVIDYLKANPDYQNVYGTEGTAFTYWIVIQVLQILNDPRAGEVLKTAYQLVQEQAARIPTEAERRMYLENLPWNREIVALWESSGSGVD